MRTFNRFTTDNTEGYSENSLKQMNAEFDKKVSEKLETSPDFENDNAFKSWCDFVSEKISSKYDK